jgi:hypothetical protein
MTDTKTASFQFRLTGVTGTPFNSRTRQNVKKPISNILYLESPPNDAVKLAYVGSEEITPVGNLFIGDRSDSIYANSKTSTTEEFISLDNNASSATAANSNFLITQQFVQAEGGYIPLYFKHYLDQNTIPESVRVFDQNFNEVSSDKWRLVYEYDYNEDTGARGDITGYWLFNSLENIFDSATGSYTVYFVQSTIGNTTTTDLLNNERAYQPATSVDFWHITPGELKPWAYVYSYQSNGSVLLPTVGKYAIRYLEQQRISVKHPSDSTDTEPWFPRIVNGDFKNGIDGVSSNYSLPEFENQDFNPIAPYKVAARKLCQKIDDRLFKLPHGEIQTGTLFHDIDIIFEKDGVVEYAITTDTTLSGTTYFDFDDDRVYDSDGDEIRWSTSDFLGVDRITGIVYVNFDILDSYKIYATYPYKENHYTLTGMMMNPIFDSDVHKQIRVIYLVPTSTHNNNSTTQTAAVMWLKVSRSGLIEGTNQDGTSGNEDLNFDTRISDTDGYKIKGALGLHYSWDTIANTQAQSPATVVEIIPDYPFYVESTDGFPREGWLRAKDTNNKYRYFKYVDKTSTSFSLSSEITEVPSNGTINIADGATVQLVNFVDERSTLTSREYSDEQNAYGASLGSPSMASQYFILAEMAVNPPYGKEKLSVIDVREDGGGIDENKYEEAKLLNPEVQWLNDYNSFDGQVYPSNAVIVVKLPKTVLDDFSLDNIREIVAEKVPYGIYPLIRFYGYEPRIISILPTATVGELEVKWEKEGSEFTYEIWYARNEKGPWTKANSYLLTDSSGTCNSFRITALDSGAPYLVRITMKDRYYSWWYGYNGYNSIAGGLGLDEDTPVPPFGNVANFQFKII